MAASIGYLKFPVTAQILSDWNSGINTDLFDTSDNTMRLWLHPGMYQPTIEDLGPRGIVRGLETAIVNNPAVAHGFELSIADSREAIAKVLETLRSANNAGTVTVWDFITVNEADKVTGYTVRTMVMAPLLRGSGALLNNGVTGDRLFQGGFTVRFTDL